MSLEDLMNVEVEVASKKGMSLRESPGIVSVISEEEITSTGARDLMDVLRLVPGVHFNSDVQGQVGISMRGNWGLEGKVLVMIDGLELNENMYGSVMFGGHYDVSQIKRIEIIRGPGSSIYGGYAELGVINIITKKGEDYNGANITATYGTMENTHGRTSLSAGFGEKIGEWEFDAKVFSSTGQRSDQTWTNQYGEEIKMADKSDLDAVNINLGLKHKGLSTRLMYDDYRTMTPSMFGEAAQHSTPTNTKTFGTEVKYDWEVKDNLTITPKVNYYHYTPWETPVDPNYITDSLTTNNAFRIESERVMTNLYADWDPLENLNVIVGGEYLYDFGKTNIIDEDEPRYYNGKNDISFNQSSVYAQLLWKTKYANVVAGGKFVNHSLAGSAQAPRLGLTKMIGKFHAKALFSQAFRMPSIENINGSEVDENGNLIIKPEQTTVYELEMGYNITPKTILTANLFDVTIKDPIIYYYDWETDAENYTNYPKSGSQGVEAEIKHKDSWGYFNLSYSFQTAGNKLDAIPYQVPGDDKSALGMPQHMLKFNTTVKIWKNLHVNNSGAWISERYAAAVVDADEYSVFEKQSSKFLWNIFLNYKDLGVKGLDLGFGINDILNQKNQFIQPYDNFMSPLPDRSREYTLRLSYTFKNDEN